MLTAWRARSPQTDITPKKDDTRTPKKTKQSHLPHVNHFSPHTHPTMQPQTQTPRQYAPDAHPSSSSIRHQTTHRQTANSLHTSRRVLEHYATSSAQLALMSIGRTFPTYHAATRTSIQSYTHTVIPGQCGTEMPALSPMREFGCVHERASLGHVSCPSPQ